MTGLGIVHGGSSYHLVTLADPIVARHEPRAVYLPDLDTAALAGLDTVVVADRVHPGILRDRADVLLSFARAGGTLVVFGEVDAHTWLPQVAWSPRTTNFWWWRTGEDPGVRARLPQHPIWAHLDAPAVTWHYHGLFTPPPGADVLVAVEEDGSDAGAVLFDDTVTTPGRIVASTLDPTYHHGSNFMPGATRFLYGILDWLEGLSLNEERPT
jgi:hypothetical protein